MSILENRIFFTNAVREIDNTFELLEIGDCTHGMFILRKKIAFLFQNNKLNWIVVKKTLFILKHKLNASKM